VSVDADVTFHSSLAVNRTVKWSHLKVTCEPPNSIRLNVSFPSVDWDFQRYVYGWAALQYQAFASGHIIVSGDSPVRVMLDTDEILEFAVNSRPSFGGDFYCFHRASKILNLAPGENRIVLRLIRDVRAMGGLDAFMSPRLTVHMSNRNLQINESSTILPDIVNGHLTSQYGSTIVRNESLLWVKVTAVRCSNVCLTTTLPSHITNL
jgi:hypothetical protein